jgi:hypothetical protein
LTKLYSTSKPTNPHGRIVMRWIACGIDKNVKVVVIAEERA